MNGWLGTVVFIAAYDFWQWRRGGETMSACWWRWSETKPGRTLCVTTWLCITVHLLGKVEVRWRRCSLPESVTVNTVSSG